MDAATSDETKEAGQLVLLFDLLNGEADNEYAVTQRIYDTNGGYAEKSLEGTTATFHSTHGHFHIDELLNFTLYRVGENGVLQRKNGVDSQSEKRGYCSFDQLIGDFSSFSNALRGTAGGGACLSVDDETGGREGQLEVSRGWGDAYRWQRSGNTWSSPRQTLPEPERCSPMVSTSCRPT